VQEDQDRLEERRRQEQLTQDREKLDHNMADLDNRFELLSSSHPDIINSIDRSKKRHADLMKEFSQVEQDLKTEEQKLLDLPGTIVVMLEQRDSVTRQGQALRSKEQPIPGSADADYQEIEAVEHQRLNLINTINSSGFA
jgi:chromosome segregation ATPase